MIAGPWAPPCSKASRVATLSLDICTAVPWHCWHFARIAETSAAWDFWPRAAIESRPSSDTMASSVPAVFTEDFRCIIPPGTGRRFPQSGNGIVYRLHPSYAEFNVGTVQVITRRLLSVEREGHQHVANSKGNVLFAITQETDRSGKYRAVAKKPPKPFAGAGVQRKNVSFERAGEYEITSRRHDAGPGGRQDTVLPLDLRGGRVEGDELSEALVGRELRARAETGHGLFGRGRAVFRLGVDAVLFAREGIEKPGQGTVAVGHPIGAAVDAGPNVDVAFGRRVVAGDQLGTAFVIEPLGPGLSYKRLGGEEFAGLAIEHIKEAVAIGPQQQLARPAAKVGIDQDRHLRRVPIVQVMGRELEVPFEFSGIGIEGNDRAGIEIISEAHVAVGIRPRIARTPVERVRLGVVGAGVPGGSAAALSRIGRPGIVGLALLGNGVEAPGQFSGGGIVRDRKST